MKSNTNKLTSFTAADALPIKVLLDLDLQKEIQDNKRILPIHIQFIPTNKCNLKCKFCSCSKRDSTQEISLDEAKQIITLFKECGTKAVTITGGGDPLMHPHINEIIDFFHENDIKIGLVTNGILFNKIKAESLNKVTWCRISHDDNRNMNIAYTNLLEKTVTSAPDVDWAFSYVVSEHYNIEEIRKIVSFANIHNFTHVRLVADLFHPEDIDMSIIKETININDSLVIYQGRKGYLHGAKDCFIGYLKPLIGADKKVYACCGVQYALNTPSYDLPEELCLGNAMDIKNIIDNSKEALDGSKCVKCYYDNYNTLLGSLIQNIEHKEFL